MLDRTHSKCVGLIVFDAHLDTREPIPGKEHSGHWMRTLSDLIDYRKAVQIGINAPIYSENYLKTAEAEGVLLMTPYDIRRGGWALALEAAIEHAKRRDGRVYLSVDIDAIDQAYAPGTSVPNAGGLLAHEVLDAVFEIAARAPIVALDVTEVSPPLDRDDMTLAAQIVISRSGATRVENRLLISSRAPERRTLLMREHRVISFPECTPFAERCFPGRPLTVVHTVGEFDAYLASSRASSLLFCGSWSHIEVGISRALAEWAIQDPFRGCGVFLAVNRVLNRACMKGRVNEFCDWQRATERWADGQGCLDPDNLSGRLFDQKLPAPAGLALTGHGAEYCIRIGSRWLSTIRTKLLAGAVVSPSLHLGALVFLNGCSLLRLGDSCVPKQYSLARNLFVLARL